MDNAASYGHLEVIQWLHANRSEGCSQSAVVNAINAGHEHVARWLVAHRKRDCIGKLGFVEYFARRGYWDVASLINKHPYHG
ncbi:Ankyrin repeat protein [Phytophthora cinnamomi]|uniref:Ankyrin repeat protein n=1 Tax=Phytophthora cinnamomi TaxID=4785 RepID=UPI00355ABF48|nr:Ankyrin repeat protein [Phytophthora cinnamomi]